MQSFFPSLLPRLQRTGPGEMQSFFPPLLPRLQRTGPGETQSFFPPLLPRLQRTGPGETQSFFPPLLPRLQRTGLPYARSMSPAAPLQAACPPIPPNQAELWRETALITGSLDAQMPSPGNGGVRLFRQRSTGGSKPHSPRHRGSLGGSQTYGPKPSPYRDLTPLDSDMPPPLHLPRRLSRSPPPVSLDGFSLFRNHPRGADQLGPASSWLVL